MIAKLVFWLFHRHEWTDFKSERLLEANGTVVGTSFIQKCKCGNYRTQKIMCSANLIDYSR